MASRPKETGDDSDWPTLESFSKLAPQAAVPSAERRRYARRDITDQSVQVARDGTEFTVVDISVDGIAIRTTDPADLLSLSVGTIVSGTLNLSNKPFSFKAVVRHQRVGIVGCQFEGLSSELKAELGHLLDPALLGKWLKPAAATDGAAWAFQGPSHTSVLIWNDDEGKMDRFVVYLLGFFTGWTRDQGLATGTVQVKRHPDHRPLEPLQWNVLGQDSRAVPDKVMMARTLIENSELPQKVAKECLTALGG